MKHFLAAGITAIALYGMNPAGASAHHNTQHSQGPCGMNPCPPTEGQVGQKPLIRCL